MAAKTKERPRFTGKQVATGAVVAVGAIAAIGAGIFFAKDKSTPRPDYDTLSEDGDLSIRHYPELVIAETVVTGVEDRKQAQNDGFRMLADYIFAKSRDGEKIAMTAPVLCDRPATDETLGDVSAGWRMRFIMPEGTTRETLPSPPEGVTLTELPARRVGAIAFSGLWSDANLEEEEGALRAWLMDSGETEAGKVEYAFYDAPMIPGPLRRNEVLIPLA